MAKDSAKKIAYHKHTLTLADPPRHDDLYIVSFPKSGATWMDFLFAHINTRMSDDDKAVNFFNIHTIIPDIHHCRQIGASKQVFPGFRVIKSHAPFNPFYNNVIYVIRDPKDVMVSYYKFLVGLGQFSGTISDLIRSSRYGIDSWINHVGSWYLKSPASLRIYFMRYEDLISDAFSTLGALYRQLGFEIPSHILNEAIEKSSFDNMKRLENEWNYGGRPVADGFTFMRKGVAGGWTSDLSNDDRTYIDNACNSLLQKFGYIR